VVDKELLRQLTRPSSGGNLVVEMSRFGIRCLVFSDPPEQAPAGMAWLSDGRAMAAAMAAAGNGVAAPVDDNIRGRACIVRDLSTARGGSQGYGSMPSEDDEASSAVSVAAVSTVCTV
jgi:hypothetical protein